MSPYDLSLVTGSSQKIQVITSHWTRSKQGGSSQEYRKGSTLGMKRKSHCQSCRWRRNYQIIRCPGMPLQMCRQASRSRRIMPSRRWPFSQIAGRPQLLPYADRAIPALATCGDYPVAARFGDDKNVLPLRCDWRMTGKWPCGG